MLAAIAALLPARYWQVLHRLPIRAMALPSAVVTIFDGSTVGGQGFMAHAEMAADRAAQAALDAAERQMAGAAQGGDPVTTLTPQLVSMASVVAFTLFTPLGLLATYLAVSGLVRAGSVVTHDATGDPVLSALDWMVRRAGARAGASLAGRHRATAEGPETPDRLFTGEGVGLAGVAFAVVASRRKPDWTSGTILATPDGWYRLGDPFDARLPHGLRTVCPLARIGTQEVLRKAVEYELPPLQRGPGRLG